MFCVQNQSFLTTEHGRIHSGHSVHSHHFLHPAVLLRERYHCRNVFVLQVFHFDFQIFLVQHFAEQVGQGLGCIRQVFGTFFFHVAGKVSVDALESYVLLDSLHMGDKRGIDVVLQNHSVHSLCAEHIDILTLLDFVGYIVDGCFFRLFCFLIVAAVSGSFPVILGCSFLAAVRGSFIAAAGSISIGFRTAVFIRCRAVRLLGLLIFLDAVFQSQIFAVDIFVQHVIHHLVGEFFILDAAEFQERVDIIPEVLISLPVCLAHTGKLVGKFLRNIIRNLLYKSVVLQSAS